MKLRDVPSLLKATFQDWRDDDALQLGAALAYYTIFSLAPLLLVVIAVAGLAFGREAAQGQIVSQIEGLVGRQGAQAVQTMLAGAGRHGSGVLATLVGLGATLLGATGAFGQLQSALNKIWEVEPREGRGILGLLKDRLLSFGLVLAIGFLLMVSLIVSAGLAALGSWASSRLPGATGLLSALSFVLSFAVITALFALMFRYLPDVRIAWRDVWTGAAATALLFTVGKFLIGLYLGRSAATSAFGAAASLVILLLWIYYSAQILFFGAELTQVYASRFGSRIVPDADAVRVEEVKVTPREAERLRARQTSSGSSARSSSTSPARHRPR